MRQVGWRLSAPSAARARENVWRVAPYFILFLFAAICLSLSYVLNIWQDEAYSLHTTGSGIAKALQQGISFEAQAPLYFVVLAAWRLINASVFHARLLSIVCALVALYTSWRFARRYLSAIHPVLLLAVLALNPITIWAAVEIRPYAAVVMFSAILLYLFFRGFVDDEPSAIARSAYVLTAILGIYTQYYVALMLPANGVALLASSRPKRTFIYAIAMIPIAAALVPLVSIVPQQLEAYHAFAVAFKIPAYAMITAVLLYAFPHNWIVSWTHYLGLNALYFVGVLIPVAMVSANIRRMRVTSRILISSTAVMFALFTAAIVIAHVHVLIPRHSIVMLVPIIFSTFALLGNVAPKRRNIATFAYLVPFIAFAALSLHHDYRSMAKLGDWRRVATFITENSKPSDPVLVFNAEAELPFRHYYHGLSVVRAIPRTMSFDNFDEDAFVLRNDRAVATSFGKFAAGHARVWLVESSACATQGDFFGCGRLESYTNAHFRAIRTVRFSGATVIELVPEAVKPTRLTSLLPGSRF